MAKTLKKEESVASIVHDAVAKTIEVCAKTVEGYIDEYPPAGCCCRHKQNIAAAIRALTSIKDAKQ